MAPEIMGKHTEFQAQVKRLYIDLTHSEVARYNQNHAAEGDTGHLKKHFCQNIVSKKVPNSLWCSGLFQQAGIVIRITHGKLGWAGIEEVTGQTPYISEWLEFDFCDHVWWLDNNHPSTTDNNIILGQWIRISHKIGIYIFYWVLTVTGKDVAWNTVHHVVCTELVDPDMK